MTLDINTPSDNVLVREIPQYIRQAYIEINVAADSIEDVETEVANARLGFTNLMSFNSALRERVTLAENEISTARGNYTTLNARFNAVEGSIELIDSELASARGAYTTLNLRLDAADADRNDLWDSIADLITDIATTNQEIQTIYLQFQLYYTKAEVDLLLSQMATDISEAMAAVVDGTAIVITSLWEFDANGGVMHVDSLPVFFSADPTVNLFQAGIGRTLLGRDADEDVSAVVDPFFTIDPADGKSIMPVTTLAPTTI